MRSPRGEIAIRTGLQPAGTRAATAWAGSVLARSTSITTTAPSGLISCAFAGSCPSGLQAFGHFQSGAAPWLVLYSHFPSGETLSAIGAFPTGIIPITERL